MSRPPHSMNRFKYKIIIVFIFCTLFSGMFFLSPAYGGTLSCSVTTAGACTGTVIYRMSGSTNAHAELPSQSNSNYANNVVCCTGVAGLGNSCSGTFAVALKLSGVTNAHVEQNNQGNYGNSACIQAPGGGSVSVGYQATNCNTFDTTLGSLSSAGTTNLHVGDGSAYTTKICASAATAGSLTADIVDSGGTPVSSPAVSMTSTTIGFGCQTSTGTLGTASEKIRVTNTTGNAAWTLSIAGGAPTALWTQGVNTFDFNDPTSSGCGDGGDTDTKAGQMTQNPSVGTITPQSGCNNTGLSLGSSVGFSEGTTNSVTLLSAGGSAGTNCYWDLTGVSLSQSIPAEQNSVTYSMNYVVTVVAN